MKTLSDYINDYKSVADRLGYTGESVNLLVQLLANASYISEVENIAYTREASLDKAILMNSKIQHCMNDMYSVYRGHCPRVVFSVKFARPVTFMLYDEILKSSSFSVYYIGYYQKIIRDDGNIDWIYNGDEDLILGSGSEETRYIVGFISPSRSQVSTTANIYNNYYIESSSTNLSNDVYVGINEGGIISHPKVSRIFSDHILYPKDAVFDLTTTDYGSRVYIADYISNLNDIKQWQPELDNTQTNTPITAYFYEYSKIEEYNTAELQRLQLKGGEIVPFDEEKDSNFLYGKIGYPERGLAFIKETERDVLSTVHYKANRSRYLHTILRSNSDVGYMLEQAFPEKVKSGGTFFKFTSVGDLNTLSIYYIPINGNALDDSDIQKFKDTRVAYYAVEEDQLEVIKGVEWTAKFEITIELYKNLAEDYTDAIGKKILKDQYENKFNVVFNDDLIGEIKTAIGKLPNIKNITNFQVTFIDSIGNFIESFDEIEIPESVYYKVESNINLVIRT